MRVAWMGKCSRDINLLGVTSVVLEVRAGELAAKRKYSALLALL
jgi:hypothetical protein